jgi:hypothetical protein
MQKGWWIADWPILKMVIAWTFMLMRRIT